MVFMFFSRLSLRNNLGLKVDSPALMARNPRVDFPGAVHHVYGRGIEKRKIYRDDRDRHVFLQRTGSNISRWKVRCIAWALMENHFHFLVQSEGGNLPLFMRCLLTGYSLYFNERHTRVGHLFQNRYKSRLITKESYLREAIRYIHLNPLRSGLVSSLEVLRDYPWTGHRQILSPVAACWMDIETLQRLFSNGGEESWKIQYSNFIEFGYSASSTGKGGAKDVTHILLEEIDFSDRRSHGDEKLPEEFLVILERISAQTGVPAEKIIAGGKRYCEVNARRDLLNACKKEMNVSVAKVSRWLGISESCGSYLLRTKNSQKGSF